jgi:hypothetical protein
MERVELSRDCDAVQVPSGNVVRLKKGTEVTISQSLGGTFTRLGVSGRGPGIDGLGATQDLL